MASPPTANPILLANRGAQQGAIGRILLAELAAEVDNRGIMPTAPLPLPDGRVPEPQLFRFGLKQMFFMLSLAGVLCGLLVGAEGSWRLVIGLAVLLVGAHVLGNLFGTRLRDTSGDVVRWRAQQSGADLPVATDQPIELAKLDLPPSTPLASRQRVARWTAWFVGGGTVAGLIFGGTTIALTVGSQIGWAGWAIGTISCGVLGAWAAFLASTFSSVARHAWRHANERSR